MWARDGSRRFVATSARRQRAGGLARRAVGGLQLGRRRQRGNLPLPSGRHGALAAYDQLRHRHLAFVVADQSGSRVHLGPQQHAADLPHGFGRRERDAADLRRATTTRPGAGRRAGDLIAYASREIGFQIFTINIDGSGERRVTDGRFEPRSVVVAGRHEARLHLAHGQRQDRHLDLQLGRQQPAPAHLRAGSVAAAVGTGAAGGRCSN